MRAQNIRTLSADRRKTVDRQARHFGSRAETRTADLRDRPELVLTERVGNSIIVVTHFD
jgi:hypothetical protein